MNDDTRTSTRRDDPEPRYAAPVSRNGSGLDLDPSEMRGKVYLSLAQVEAARMAGMAWKNYSSHNSRRGRCRRRHHPGWLGPRRAET
jgi:hypothetical protein